MASPTSLLSPGAMEALGWTLVHFIWQGAAIAAASAALMNLCRGPGARYVTGVAALALMLAMPAATFVVLLLSSALPSLPAAMAGFLPVLAPPPDILPWLVQCWLAGVTLLSLRFAGGFLLLDQKRRRQSTEPAAPVLALCRAVQQRLRIHRAISYLECGWLQVPAVIGFIRPAILLPVAVLTGLSEVQLRAVVAHELAHVRRWDLLVNLFQILAETLLFYHPAVWWLNRRINAERELCCDEAAMAEAGDGVEYARALVLMAQLGSAPSLSMAATHGILSERIFHILGRNPLGAKPSIAALAGSFFLLMASLAMAAVLVLPAVPAVPKNMRVVSAATASLARPQPPVAAVPRPDDNAYVIPRRVAFKAVSPPRISFIPAPILIAGLDFPPAPDATPEAPPHVLSIAAEEVDAPPTVYPAPSLKLNASHVIGEWTHGDTINYCRDFAVQTVAQGANQPLSVDDGVKQRLAFFNWQCLISNYTGENRQYGDGWGRGPAYSAIGAASPDHPANVSGNWTLSLGSPPYFLAQAATRMEAQSCAFHQSGNAINGTCTGPTGSGAITGIIDGNQVRWAWKFTYDDGDHEGEFDFIGMVGPDGAITGQSINLDRKRPQAFTATHGPAQVAQK